MNPSPCCSEAFELSNNFYDPLRLSWLQDGESYHKNPRLARFKWVAINAFQGLIKPFLFPAWAAVGAVAMPIIATIQACRGKPDEARAWLGAWCFSLLGAASCIIFFTLSACFLPMNAAAAIVMSAVVVSITLHVWRACKDPTPPPRPHTPVMGLFV